MATAEYLCVLGSTYDPPGWGANCCVAGAGKFFYYVLTIFLTLNLMTCALCQLHLNLHQFCKEIKWHPNACTWLKLLSTYRTGQEVHCQWSVIELGCPAGSTV